MAPVDKDHHSTTTTITAMTLHHHHHHHQDVLWIIGQMECGVEKDIRQMMMMTFGWLS